MILQNEKGNTIAMGGVKTRRSNLELYRIIVMMLIVAHHYVGHGGFLEVMAQAPITTNSIYLYLLGMWGKTGINCFVLITGYFMCRSHITLRKFLKLLLEVMFYNIVIWAIFVGTGYESFSLKSMYYQIFPLTSVSMGFTSCFLIFYLFIPFLTILVNHLDRKMHQRLILLSLFVYSFLYTIPLVDVIYNYVTWFCILFFISSYIRIYGLLPKLKNSQWGWLTLLSVIISACGTLIIIPLKISASPYRLVQDSNALMAVIVAVCSFMYFKDLSIKQSKIINTISASTFGVLLIHDNSYVMRQWLWKDTLNNVGQYSSDHLFLYSLASIVGVFMICILLDYIRIHTFEKWFFRFLDSRK